MKRFPVILILLIVAFTMVTVLTPAEAATDKITLQIEGMTWASWPLIIRKALEGLEGVEKANISLREKRGEVFFDPDKVTETEIVNKVNQIGFEAKGVEK